MSAIDKMHKIMAKYLSAMLEEQEEVPSEIWKAITDLLQSDAASGVIVPCFSVDEGKLKVKVLHSEFLVDLWEDDLEDLIGDCLDKEDSEELIKILEDGLAKAKQRLAKEFP